MKQQIEKIKLLFQKINQIDWKIKVQDLKESLKESLKSKHTRKKVLICLGGMILLLAAAFTLFINPLLKKDKLVYKETEVKQGDLVLGIQESGSLDLNAKDVTYDIVLESDEDEEDDDDEEDTQKYLTIEETYIAAGSRIQKGDKLIKFTDDSVASCRRQLESVKTDAEVTYEEVKAEYDISVLSAKSVYDTSVLEAENADRIYAAETSTVTNEIKKLQEDMVVLQGEINGLQDDLKDENLWESYKEAKTALTSATNTLNDTSINNPAGYTANYDTYTKAKATYDQLQEQIDSINENIDKKQKEIQSLNVELQQKQSEAKTGQMNAAANKATAELSNENAESIYGYTVASLEESVTKAYNTLADAESMLEEFEAFVGEDNTIYAPESGVITTLNYENGDELIATGSIFSYATGTEDTITVDVAEEDVVDIRVQDTVEIQFSAYPEETYQGIITQVQTKTTDNHESTINYPVTIQVEGDTKKLYGGMTGDVTFSVDSKENVLYVSKKAIVEQDDKTYVYQKNTLGKMELIPVTTGFSNGADIEIVEGLNKGNIIYIASRVSADNAQDLKKE